MVIAAPHSHQMSNNASQGWDLGTNKISSLCRTAFKQKAERCDSVTRTKRGIERGVDCSGRLIRKKGCVDDDELHRTWWYTSYSSITIISSVDVRICAFFRHNNSIAIVPTGSVAYALSAV